MSVVSLVLQFSVTFQTVTLTSSYNYSGSSNGTWSPPGYDIPATSHCGKAPGQEPAEFPAKTNLELEMTKSKKLDVDLSDGQRKIHKI